MDPRKTFLNLKTTFLISSSTRVVSPYFGKKPIKGLSLFSLGNLGHMMTMEMCRFQLVEIIRIWKETYKV